MDVTNLCNSEIDYLTKEIIKLKNDKKRLLKNVDHLTSAYHKISDYLMACDYDQDFADIFESYEKFRNGYYISHTSKDIIKNCYMSIKILYDEGYRC